jgi:membrane-associated protein
MDTITLLIDFILHIDRYLEAFVQAYGVWIYVILFLIVFVETGLVVMPFLPGDSLLFVVGALAGAELLNLPLVLGLLTAAAILGDQCNYFIGRHFGQRLLNANTRWFNRRAYDQAHAFYERYGSITIVLARFLPFIRTLHRLSRVWRTWTVVASRSSMSWVHLFGFGVFALPVICLAISIGSKPIWTKSFGP